MSIIRPLKWHKTMHEKPTKTGFYLCYSSFNVSPTVMHYRGTGVFHMDWCDTCNDGAVQTMAERIVAALDIAKAVKNCGVKLTKEQQLAIVDSISAAVDSYCIENAGIEEEDSMPPEYWCELPDLLDIDEGLENIDMECYSVAATVADIVAIQVANALASAVNNTTQAPWSKA